MKWISVWDKMPPSNTDVLVACAKGGWCDIAMLEGEKWIRSDEREVDFRVSHWCEIKLPKEDA